MSTPRRQRSDYNIAWICFGIPNSTAAMAMLDRQHENLNAEDADSNSYTLGEIGGHNVVIVNLPDGKPGIILSAIAATRLSFTFPAVKHRLMVGIGGGIPKYIDVRLGDIRLGDIVVATSNRQSPAVVYPEYGSKRSNGEFDLRQIPIMEPSAALTQAVDKLAITLRMADRPMSDFLASAVYDNQRLPKDFKCDDHPDMLFDGNYAHVNPSDHRCYECDRSKEIIREGRYFQGPEVYCRPILSTSYKIRDAEQRDFLAAKTGAICCDSEAAGVVAEYACLVITGIYCYADSHSNSAWIPYAAAAAATYAKELLKFVPAPFSKNAIERNPTEYDRLEAIRQLQQGFEASVQKAPKGTSAQTFLYGDDDELHVDHLKLKCANRWHKEYAVVHQRMYDIEEKTNNAKRDRVKIAILDTGLELSENQWDTYNPRKDMKFKSWVDSIEEISDSQRDEVGHGTHLATLLAKMAQNAQIHIARVIKARTPNTTSDPKHIAHAIRFAVNEWGVDIIVMAFGFAEEQDTEDEVDSMLSAIEYADKKKVTIFAAASNDGHYKPEGPAWPARSRSVICVHAADGAGRPSWFTPGPRDGQRVMVLGECVQSAWPEKFKVAGNMKYMSGTSCAAPIAAAVAAAVLDIARPLLSEEEWKNLRRKGSMMRMLEKMEDKTIKDYQWLLPWGFFNATNHSMEWIRDECRELLRTR